MHPEDTCDDCNGPNFVWWAAGDRWQAATGEPNGPILCPGCFVKRWEAATGFTCMWKLEPDDRTIRAQDCAEAPEPSDLAWFGPALQGHPSDKAAALATRAGVVTNDDAMRIAGEMIDGLLPCNVRLAHNTVGRLHAVRLASGASNMADALSLAIKIASEVMHAQSAGAKVMIVNGDDQRALVIG